MANKRKLKKSINNLTVELVNECFTFMCFHNGEKYEKAKTVIAQLLISRNQLIQLTNGVPTTEDKKLIRKHCTVIKERMSEMVKLMDVLA